MTRYELVETAADVQPLVAPPTDFTSVFQPIVDVASRRVAGFEGLTRFEHEGSESAFASAARRGTSIDLELATLEQLIDAGADLPPDAYLALNASPDLLSDQRLFHLLPDDRSIVLELSERFPVHDYDVVRRAVRSLPGNVQLGIDDVGAGFSSLRHLLELRPSIVKIDRSLVANLDRDARRWALISGLVSFASESECALVAEGIETEGELEAARDLGIDLVQGYLTGRPGRVETFGG